MQPEMKWYIVLPLTLLVFGGFGVLAWIHTGGELPELNFASAPVLTEEEQASEQVIELIPDDPEPAVPAAETVTSENASEQSQDTGTSTVTADEVASSTPPAIEVVEVGDLESEIVALHNEERAQLDVSDLAWSDSLAATAQAWADDLSVRGCVLEHSNTNVGENLYYSWSTGDIAIDPEPAILSWSSEKEYYDYETNTCAEGEVCGHYTQIVWANTTAVGCGVATCSDDTANGQLWVCQYSPAGNIIGQSPY